MDKAPNKHFRVPVGAMPLLGALLLIFLFASPSPLAGQDVIWIRQFGTPATDTARGVAVDGDGNAYLVGDTDGTLPGQTPAGSDDAWVRKYDSAGTELWTRQFGTSVGDTANGVAVDVSGNAYVVGFTGGMLPGQTPAGSDDAWVRKYDSAGTELWTRQFGTLAADTARAVVVGGSGNAYVMGYTDGTLSGQTSSGGTDAYLRMYDSNGTELWTHQFGTPSADAAFGAAVDGGSNAYVVGYANGTLSGQTPAGGADAYVRKYDSAGTELWTRQFGTLSSDYANGVAVDGGGNAYIVGRTDGTLSGQTPAGGDDAYLRKYDSAGTELWTRQFGTPAADAAFAVAVDGEGNAHVVGYTAGTLPGQTLAGDDDAYVRKYDSAGTELWTRQFGTPASDFAEGVAVDGGGNAHVVGLTDGTVPGQTSSGARDAYVEKVGLDTDADGVPDSTDNCPVTPNSGQENDVHPITPVGDACENPDGDPWPDGEDGCPDVSTPWQVPPDDIPDCDGFPRTTQQGNRGPEAFIGTDPDVGCGGTNAWPVDVNGDNKAGLGDILAFIPHFGGMSPGPSYSARFDLNADGVVGLQDILMFIPFFNLTCTP